MAVCAASRLYSFLLHCIIFSFAPVSRSAANTPRLLPALLTPHHFKYSGAAPDSSSAQPVLSLYLSTSQFFGRKALVASLLTIFLIGTTVGMTVSHINAIITSKAL